MLGSVSVFGLLVIAQVTYSLSRTEVLDEEGNFTVAWEADERDHLVTFTLNVSSTGWVGFGISNNDSSRGADFIIGGVYPNGSSYFSDRHGVNDSYLAIDERQDWKLLSSQRKLDRVILKFSRICLTGDAQDVPFTMNSQRFLFAYGKNDEVDYSKATKGSYPVNIFDYPNRPFDKSKYEEFGLIMNMTVPVKASSCSYMIHKTPTKYNSKSYVIAMFPSVGKDARPFVLGFTVYKCDVQKIGQETEAYFEPLRQMGLIDGSDAKFPDIKSACQPVIYSWASGVRDLILPQGVGFLHGMGGRSEYYLMEIRLINPQLLRSITFAAGVNFYVSSEGIRHEAGLLSLKKEASYLLIPPSSPNFHVSGQCSPTCTSRSLPSSGINVFAIQLHGHGTARNMSVHHVRGTVALPLIADDQNYCASFQNIRFRKPANVLPGDHLFIECGYDTTKYSRVMYGGSSEDEEVCESSLYYWPRGNLVSCGSENCPSKMFPILNITVDKYSGIPEEDQPQFQQAVNKEIAWGNATLKVALEHYELVGTQMGYCERLEPPTAPQSNLPELQRDLIPVSFPKITSYSGGSSVMEISITLGCLALLVSMISIL